MILSTKCVSGMISQDTVISVHIPETKFLAADGVTNINKETVCTILMTSGDRHHVAGRKAIIWTTTREIGDVRPRWYKTVRTILGEGVRRMRLTGIGKHGWATRLGFFFSSAIVSQLSNKG